jgi:predicted transcriptional regulator
VPLDELRAPEVAEDPEVPSAEDIKRALQSLPFNQRSAIVMRELEGRRQSEIASALGLSESAVEALLFRARRAMREQLEAAITCGEAERAVSRQLDRSLPRAERGRLRAHLRECEECATFARQARAQRGALKSLGAVPLPASLLSWGGGGASVAGAGAGMAIGVKVAVGVAAVVVAVGAGDLGIRYLGSGSERAHPAEREAGAAAPRGGATSSGSSSAGASDMRARVAARRGASGPGPSARGHAGSRAGGRPGTHRSPARAHGAPGSGHDNGVRAHGTPAATHGPPTRAHGTPTRAHGNPTRAHGPGAGHRGNGSPGRPAHTHPTPAHGHPAPAHGPPAAHAHSPPRQHPDSPGAAHGNKDPNAPPKAHPQI